ncbi:MAG TPA: cytochrome c, partial [Pirellulales bacterium]|nr:cytochrome c [Pirellulales bacterium]
MRTATLIVLCLAIAAGLKADDARPASNTADESLAERGYRLLTTKAYLPADFDQQVFDELWKTWEEPLR